MIAPPKILMLPNAILSIPLISNKCLLKKHRWKCNFYFDSFLQFLNFLSLEGKSILDSTAVAGNWSAAAAKSYKSISWIHICIALCVEGGMWTQAESFIWLPTHISKARGIKTDKLGSFFFYHFFLVGGPRECLIKVLLAAWVADFSSLIFTCILIFILRWNHFLSGLWESSFHLNFHFGCAASSRGKATVVSAFKC